MGVNCNGLFLVYDPWVGHWLYGLIIKKEGVTLKQISSGELSVQFLTGSLGIIMGLGDGVLFATAGTMAI